MEVELLQLAHQAEILREALNLVIIDDKVG